MRRVRRVRPGRGCRPHDLLRPAGAAASRPGKCRYCRGGWRDHHGVEGPGPGHPGVRRSELGRARGLRRRRACALFHVRRRRVVGGRAAAHFGHRRDAHRARAQWHAREHEQPARAPYRRGHPAACRHRLRSGREGHRQRHAADAPFARGHPLRHGESRGRLRHGAGQPRLPLRLPRPQRHPPAVHRRAAGWPRLGRVLGNLRPGHRGRQLRARRRAGRDRALQQGRRHLRARRARRQARELHFRVRLLRPPRFGYGRAERLPGAPQHGAHPGARGPGRRRFGARRARLRHSLGHGIFRRKRHSLFRRHREEPLRGPHVHPAHAGHAPAGHPPEAQPAAQRHRRQASRGHR